MRVMGIDPSSRTGVAVVESGKLILHTEEIEFKKLNGFERLSQITGRVMALREEFDPDLIVLEEMIVGHLSSAIPVIQIGTVLRYFLWQEGFTWEECNPSVLKKFIAGSGNASKEAIMMNVLKHWKFEPSTNNIADAVGLAMLGLCILGETFQVGQTLLCRSTFPR